MMTKLTTVFSSYLETQFLKNIKIDLQCSFIKYEIIKIYNTIKKEVEI